MSVALDIHDSITDWADNLISDYLHLGHWESTLLSFDTDGSRIKAQVLFNDTVFEVNEVLTGPEAQRNFTVKMIK